MLPSILKTMLLNLVFSMSSVLTALLIMDQLGFGV